MLASHRQNVHDRGLAKVCQAADCSYAATFNEHVNHLGGLFGVNPDTIQRLFFLETFPATLAEKALHNTVAIMI